MKLRGIDKWVDGKFTHLYHLNYETKSGNTKIYEMVSRNAYIANGDDVKGKDTSAVIILALNKEHTEIVMNKEFRMAVNDFVYNLPAGLIENEESVEKAAARELYEETGLSLIKVIDVLLPSYSSVGFSNEKTMMVICEAEGDFDVSNAEDCEEIEPLWVSKERAKEILKSDKILCAARTQILLYMWVNKL